MNQFIPASKMEADWLLGFLSHIKPVIIKGHIVKADSEKGAKRKFNIIATVNKIYKLELLRSEEISFTISHHIMNFHF